MYRLFSLLAIVAICLFASAPVVAADDKADVHTGKVVKVGDGKLTMTDKDGKEHSHTIRNTTKISIDGKDAKLEDLKAGQEIKVTMENKQVTRIEARK